MSRVHDPIRHSTREGGSCGEVRRDPAAREGHRALRHVREGVPGRSGRARRDAPTRSCTPCPTRARSGLVNLLTTTRVLRKGFKTHLVLYGPGVLMASGSRGFPKVGDEAFPGHMAINNQLRDVHRRGRHRLRVPVRLGRAVRLPGEPADGGRQAVPPARRARRGADRVARQGVPAEHLDRLSAMLVLDREAAIAAWRRAEARIYPSVMVNAELYQQYIGVVRAIADELRDVHTEDELVAAWHERARRRPRGRVAARAPPMLALMDLERGARRRVLPSPPRDHARAGQGARRASGWSARARAAPSGSSCSRTSRRSAPTGSRCTCASGRALHASAELPLDAGRPTFTLEVVQLDPARRRVAARQAAADAGADLRHPRGMGGAHRAGARPVREALTMATHPKKIIDAHCHIGEIPPWKFYDLEHPVKPTVYDYADTKEFVKSHMDYFKVERALDDVQLRRAGPRALVRPQRRRDGRGDDQRPHPGGDLGVVPAAQRGADAQGAQAGARDARGGAEDDVPARRQPRPGDVGRGDARRSRTRSSTSARSTT